MGRVAPDMRSFGLWLCAASIYAIGLERTAREGRSINLLGPGRKDMICESGCEFQLFCLPEPCSEDEVDAGTCNEEAMQCSDELCNSVKSEPCPVQLRAQLCAKTTGGSCHGAGRCHREVCEQRMGVQSYDRDAQAAQREAEKAMMPDEDKVVVPERICIAMSPEALDDWCTMICNYDASSCDPKACRCGTSADVRKWRKEKQKSDEDLEKQPWDVENSCDFDAIGCNKKLTKDCASAANLTCAAHITNCMATPQVDKNGVTSPRGSLADCAGIISRAVEECSDCGTPASKDAFALRLGPNAADPNAKNEAEEERVRETSEANAKAFDKVKAVTDEKNKAAEQRRETAIADAIAAATMPPPSPPFQPPAPPSPPAPPNSPKMEAKDLFAANRKQAEKMYQAAKADRKEAEDTAEFAKEAVLKLPPGDEQNDAKEVADRAAEALSAATVKEADAKEFWDRAVEAEERFSASTDPTLRTASGSMKAPGGKDIAAEEKRKADEAERMAKERQKELEAEAKRKADEAARAAGDEATKQAVTKKESEEKQKQLEEEAKRKNEEHARLEDDRREIEKAEEARKAADDEMLAEEQRRQAEEADRKAQQEKAKLEEQEAEQQLRANEKLDEYKRKVKEAKELGQAIPPAPVAPELPAPVVPMDVDSGIAAAMDANADALKLNDDATAEIQAKMKEAKVSGTAAAMDANADALRVNDDATAEIQERMKEATEAQKRVTTENAAMDAVRRGEGSQPAR